MLGCIWLMQTRLAEGYLSHRTMCLSAHDDYWPTREATEVQRNVYSMVTTDPSCFADRLGAIFFIPTTRMRT